MVTLEISSTDIRLLQFEGGKVIKWASLSLEPGVFEEEVISDPQALGAAVKQLMASSGISARDITVSVSGLYSLSRIVMVPAPAGGSVTHLAVLEAVEEKIPFSEEEMYLSWQTIASGEDEQQVLVVGVPRDVIDSEIMALKAAGINPRILDLKAMALARAVSREQALILNIEPISFDIVVVINSVTGVMRTTAWQPDDLSVEDKVEQLAAALELTVAFHNLHNPDLPVDLSTPLFITGKMSGDLTLVEKLRDRVGYPIETLSPPLQYPTHLPVSQYAVNIGLALKGITASKNVEQEGYSLPDINLLPQNYLPWKPSAKHIYSVVAVVAVMALLFPLYQLASSAMDKTATVEARYNIVNNEMELRQIEIKNRQPLQQAVNEYGIILDMGGGFVDDLNIIKSLAGELGVKVESITHEGSSITFACQADSYLIFRDYIAALEESGRFTTPVIPPEGYPYIQSGTIKLVPKPAE